MYPIVVVLQKDDKGGSTCERTGRAMIGSVVPDDLGVPMSLQVTPVQDDLEEVTELLLEIEAYDLSIIEPLGRGVAGGSLNRTFRVNEVPELTLKLMPRNNHRVEVVRDMIEGLLQGSSLKYGEFKQIVDWLISNSHEFCGLRPCKVRRSVRLVARELRPEFTI
jgi:hypothetical protein